MSSATMIPIGIAIIHENNMLDADRMIVLRIWSSA
jgi:hypothetical protein